MKISEVRNIIKDYKNDDLQYLVAELYKLVPKQKLQENDVDEMISHVEEIRSAPKVKKKTVKEIQSIDDLVREVDELILDAKNEYYLRPNNIIPKKERSKFRFKVKGYYTALLKNYNTGEDAVKAAEALRKLYELMCYGCVYYITNSNDQFRSVGIEQTVFFESVVRKNFLVCKDEAMIEKMLMLVSERGLSYTSLNEYMEHILLEYLDTSSVQEMAIQKAKELYDKYYEPVQSRSRFSGIDIDGRRPQVMADMITCIHFRRGEYEKGIEYYKNHFVNYTNDREIMYYCLLRWLKKFDLKKYWLKEYEKEVKEKLDIREETIEEYQYLKKHQEFINQTFCGQWL